MNRFAVFVAVATIALVSGEDAELVCNSETTSMDCDALDACTWCWWSNYRSRCWPVAQAKKLPTSIWKCNKNVQVPQNSSCLTPQQEHELKEAVKGISTLLATTVVALDIAAAAESDPKTKADLLLASKIISAVDSTLVANLTKIANEACGTCSEIVQAVSDAVDSIKQTLEKIDPNWENDPIWKAVFTAVNAILAIVKDVCPSFEHVLTAAAVAGVEA